MRWSWQNHPETGERFANSLLNHVLKDFAYLGAPLQHQCRNRSAKTHLISTRTPSSKTAAPAIPIEAGTKDVRTPRSRYSLSIA